MKPFTILVVKTNHLPTSFFEKLPRSTREKVEQLAVRSAILFFFGRKYLHRNFEYLVALSNGIDIMMPFGLQDGAVII